jgi:integrase/recombinase XerC
MAPLLETIMDLIASFHATPKTFLLTSALAPHLDAFTAHLRRGRYATNTTQRYAAGIAHFARWMTQCDLPVRLLDEHTVEQFLGNHLPHCNCLSPVMRVHDDLRAALGHLLEVLREQGAITEPPLPTGDIADELRRYDEHMHNARGLSAGTRCGRLRTVQRLLLHKFGIRPVVFAELRSGDVRLFIAEQLELLGTTSNAKTLASAMRDYFGYRTTCGDQVHGLLGVISSPAHWSLASLPRSLKPAEVDRLLESFNSSLPSPKRGYAIVRCALDMGLRSGEIAKLQLTDIDWRVGTVTLKRTKSLRQDILPLPTVTGQALADYVRHERPKTTNPSVFVRIVAPRDQPIGADAIRRVIRDAYRRIGLTHGRTHALRHTLACRLVNHGSSLKEVADVLRHRSLNTSLIYAKLDNSRLAAVALPWPGSAT